MMRAAFPVEGDELLPAAQFFGRALLLHGMKESENGGPSGTRTPDQEIKSLLLYQLS